MVGAGAQRGEVCGGVRVGRARDVLAPWRATGAGLCGSRLGRWGWLGAARIWHSRRCARRAEVWGCTDDRLLQCASFVPVWRIRLACWGLFWGGDDARLRTGRPDLGMSKPEAGCGALWERFEDAAAVVVCGSAMTCTCRMVVVLGCCLTEEGGSIRGWMQVQDPIWSLQARRRGGRLVALHSGGVLAGWGICVVQWRYGSTSAYCM